MHFMIKPRASMAKVLNMLFLCGSGYCITKTIQSKKRLLYQPHCVHNIAIKIVRFKNCFLYISNTFCISYTINYSFPKHFCLGNE